jgi:tetratricopeptide (TPR) repeat protein
MLERYEEALSAFEKVLKQDPNDPTALAQMAFMLHATDKIDEALRAVNDALALDSNNAWALPVKGMILVSIGDFQAAAEVLKVVDDASPLYDAAMGVKGTALYNLGPEHSQEAKRAFEAALNGDPENLFWQASLGETLRLLGEIEQAHYTYARVIEQANRTPISTDTLSLMCWCQYRLGNFEEAARLGMRTLSRGGEQVSAVISTQFDLALILMCSGRYSLAVREYQRGLEFAQDVHPLRRHSTLGMALRDLQEALRERPKLSNNAWALGSKGQVLKALNRYEEAVEALQRAVELDPNMAWAQAELADVLRMQGHYEEALSASQRALELEPDNVLALRSKSDTSRMLGRRDEAPSTLEQVLRQDPYEGS